MRNVFVLGRKSGREGVRSELVLHKSNNILITSVLYIILLANGVAAAETAQALARLAEAFDRSARAEYIAEVPVAFPEFPDIRKAIYYR